MLPLKHRGALRFQQQTCEPPNPERAPRDQANTLMPTAALMMEVGITVDEKAVEPNATPMAADTKAALKMIDITAMV